MFSTLSTMSFSKLLKLVELQILYWIYTVWIVCAWVRCDRTNVLVLSDHRGDFMYASERLFDPEWQPYVARYSFATHLPPR